MPSSTRDAGQPEGPSPAYRPAGLLARGSSRGGRLPISSGIPVRPLPAYSDEFARDFHPVPFSPDAARPTPACVFGCHGYYNTEPEEMQGGDCGYAPAAYAESACRTPDGRAAAVIRPHGHVAGRPRLQRAGGKRVAEPAARRLRRFAGRVDTAHAEGNRQQGLS